jgi:hypothetical protein
VAHRCQRGEAVVMRAFNHAKGSRQRFRGYVRGSSEPKPFRPFHLRLRRWPVLPRDVSNCRRRPITNNSNATSIIRRRSVPCEAYAARREVIGGSDSIVRGSFGRPPPIWFRELVSPATGRALAAINAFCASLALPPTKNTCDTIVSMYGSRQRSVIDASWESFTATTQAKSITRTLSLSIMSAANP